MKRYASVFLILLLVLLIPTFAIAKVRDQFLLLFRPLSRVLVKENTSLHNTLLSLKEISSLRQDNEQLRTEIISLQQQVSDQETITRENQSLRKELGVTSVTRDTPKLLGHIILQGSDPLDRTVTLDIGSAQGVKEGQPAVSQGTLLGRVVSVQKNSSVVRYITSRQSKIQAWVASNREKGLLVGDGNSAYLTEITQGVTVKPQDVVETSGLGGSLPQGILIGQINEATSKPSDLSQRFSITLPQDPSSIESLFVLLTDEQ